MDICTKACCPDDVQRTLPSSELKECLKEYKLQDKVDALKNHFGIRDNLDPAPRTLLRKRESAPQPTVKDCLRPQVPSTFQTLVNDDLRDTVRNAYWNKEIGRTIYLPPYLPAGCDPVATTFGKIMTPDEYGVPELINPREVRIDNPDIHKLYRKTHNDYYPSEQIDRNYAPPFDKSSSFGDAKKTADFSGKKVADCMRWFGVDSMTLVSLHLADYAKLNQARLGRVKNCEKNFAELTLGRFVRGARQGVAEVLKESKVDDCDTYCTDYAEKISKLCGSSRAVINRTAGIPGERTDLPYVVVPDGAARADREHLGDQTSVMALVSPNTFTQLGLSHIDFFKVREYEEMRSIFDNVGVKFPGNCFDVLWREGLSKDCTGGVCVETFRNLVARLAMNNFMSEMR